METLDITLSDYKYAPGFSVCLFSLTKAIKNGWKLLNSGLVIVLWKGKDVLKFDWINRTPDGVVCYAGMLTRTGEHGHCSKDSESGGEGKVNSDLLLRNDAKNDQDKKDKGKLKPKAHWDINRFHKIFGHASKEPMKVTAKASAWKLTGKLEPCKDCQMSNAQQKKVSKTTETESTTPGERMFVDMSSVSRHQSLGGARVWLCAVDDATRCVWNHLLKSKSQAPKKLIGVFTKLHD
jgi:hypothetical protein